MKYDLPSSLSAHASNCGCPACADLRCLERPRFFAGQLLTEAELNSEQAWVIAKNRLHNRYLHGPGVVCGLQVVCGDCDGHVTVRSGYAIDPCGNDIVVCADTDFDVIKAIEECSSASRSRRSDCDPYAKLWSERCTDVEETWCITIRYEETEARATTALPLRTTGGRYRCTSAGCGCRGCGGKSGGSSAKAGTCTGACGCGGGSAATGTPAASTQPAACQPTRILEGFRLGLTCEPAKDDDDVDWIDLLAPSGSLLRRLIDCALDASALVQKYMTKTDLAFVFLIAEGKYDSIAPSLQYTAVCHLRQAVIALYAKGGCNVRCEAARILGTLGVPSPGQDTSPGAYGQSVQPIVQSLATLALQYLIDCWCCAFLPSCDAGAMDDRLLLACVTVKDGRVLRICNLGPRQFAGAFPSIWYWLSIVPLVPLIRYLLEKLCCGTFEVFTPDSPDTDSTHGLTAGSKTKNMAKPQAKMKSSAPAAPTNLSSTAAGSWLSLFAGDNFAVPRDLFKRAERLLTTLPASGLLPGLASSAIDRNAVDLRALLGGDPEKVQAAFAHSGVQPILREVSGDQVDEVRGVALASPLAVRGDRLVIYRSGDRIVGFARGDDGPAAAKVDAKVAADSDAAAQIASLRQELHQLRGEVSRLRKH